MTARVTEKESKYKAIDRKSTFEILTEINKEDQLVALAVESVIPAVEALVETTYKKMEQGGRLFYIGAGTSGRLGIVDASECPPTFGVPDDWIVGIIAGGDGAIRKAVEFAEDDVNLAWKDLQKYDLTTNDVVIGIAASGTTPYVINGLQTCQEHKITTGSISCNPDSPISKVSNYPIEVVVGPEYITGSTRMKAGTAQKLVLNMISTAIMIRLGRVVGNKMVDMQLSNNKLVDRGTKMVMKSTDLDYESAKQLLQESGSVRAAIERAGQH